MIPTMLIQENRKAGPPGRPMDGEGGLLSYRKLRFYTIKTLREDAPSTFLFALLVNFLYIPSEESKFCYNKKGIKRRDKKKGISMEQYKVILVDDEVEVIDIMKQKIRWNDLGFNVVGSATNGVKALELVEKLQPDVVLTDIKMPYMDGLELARKLNQDYPNIYIMLCTGF